MTQIGSHASNNFYTSYAHANEQCNISLCSRNFFDERCNDVRFNTVDCLDYKK